MTQRQQIILAMIPLSIQIYGWVSAEFNFSKAEELADEFLFQTNASGVKYHRLVLVQYHSQFPPHRQYNM
jgi:hypothetical protein